jgi:8-hydroxy-5-deazaflavin:NADPH oxidoreductase
MLDIGAGRDYAMYVRIAIVGAGRIGGNAARLWSRVGHEVVICFSRHPAELGARATELGGDVRAAAPADAVLDADVVMLAVPWGAIDQALVGPLAGKVVLDATNQFGAGPKPAEGQTVARFNSARMPGAPYVRGFNTLTSGFQAEASGRPGAPKALAVAEALEHGHEIPPTPDYSHERETRQ